MKSSCFIIVMLLIALYANAQKCLYLQNRVSGMDGTRLIITKPVVFSSHKSKGALEIWSTIYGDTAIVLAFVMYPKETMSVHKEDTVVITLENSDRIYLSILQNAVTVGESNLKLTALSIIEPEVLKKLEKYSAGRIDFTTSQGILSFAAGNKKQSNTIRYLISCVKGYRITK